MGLTQPSVPCHTLSAATRGRGRGAGSDEVLMEGSRPGEEGELLRTAVWRHWKILQHVKGGSGSKVQWAGAGSDRFVFQMWGGMA